MVEYTRPVKDIPNYTDDSELILRLVRIEDAITEIKNSLVGTLERQGFIGETRTRADRQQVYIDELLMWKNEINQSIKMFFFKIIGSVGAVVTVGAIIAIAIVKWMVL